MRLSRRPIQTQGLGRGSTACKYYGLILHPTHVDQVRTSPCEVVDFVQVLQPLGLIYRLVEPGHDVHMSAVRVLAVHGARMPG